jgi:glutamine cyclotransferase
MKWAWLLLFCAAIEAEAVENLDFEVMGQLPHSRQDFTQGLEIHAGRLYQSTGGYGRSRIQVFDLKTGDLLRERRLPPQVFGEGLTVQEGRVIQLTWRAGRALIYRIEDFEPIGEFPLPGEGWGLASDGERLVYSDGSATLRFLSPADGHVTGEITVRRNGIPVKHLNELEWTPRGILANVWRREVIVCIDPETGEVTGEIDLTGLLPASERRAGTDVLNGIALDRADGSLWVTGKNWPWLYRLRLKEVAAEAGERAGNWEAAGKNQ